MKRWGPGLSESTYKQCLDRDLNLSGINFKIQVPLPAGRCELCVLGGEYFIPHALKTSAFPALNATGQASRG
ncbi:MAG: GxxExxY protein [Candidatus Omnitrophica bacterium]|nr:GxxExxY protein [Candidatus Omnitrophota bacterium]